MQLPAPVCSPVPAPQLLLEKDEAVAAALRAAEEESELKMKVNASPAAPEPWPVHAAVLVQCCWKLLPPTSRLYGKRQNSMRKQVLTPQLQWSGKEQARLLQL